MPTTIVTQPAQAGPISIITANREVDEDALRALVHRRLALRHGLTLSVAAAIAQLAGLGPEDRRGRR